MLYEWSKALHIISVIVWMTGLLCLPHLFAYHVETAAKSATFRVMEQRLYKRVMMPAMIGTVILVVLKPF